MRPVLQWSSLAFAALVVAASVLWMRVSGGAVLQPWPAGAVTAVLFTTRHDEEGHPRLPFLLASLCKHANVTGVIHELIVVTPDNEVRHMISALRVPNGALWNRGRCLPPWPVRVVPDSEAIPTPRKVIAALLPLRERTERGGRGTGYRLQMLLKLGVSSLVQTRHYLTLDSDMFATREVKLLDLVSPEGKARVQADRANHRDAWWRAAQAILAPDGNSGEAPTDLENAKLHHFRECVRATEGLGIGVTPAVLDVQVVQALLAHLEQQWGMASVASCPDPIGGTDGSDAKNDDVWRPIAGTECSVGDAVTAVWAGNKQRLPASIAALGANFIEVNWADKDPSFRRVLPELVVKQTKTARVTANHQDYPCSRRPLCEPASEESGASLMRRWDEVLMDLSGVHDWSEYTLYWGKSCLEGWHIRRHAQVQIERPLYDDLDGGYADAERAFRSGDGPTFGVLQSIAGADQQMVNEKLSNMLQLSS